MNRDPALFLETLQLATHDFPGRPQFTGQLLVGRADRTRPVFTSIDQQPGKPGVHAAKRHVLMALEEAPRFRAAQRLLLQIVDGRPAGQDKTPLPAQAREALP